MKTPLFVISRRLLASAILSLALATPALRAADDAPVVAKPSVNSPVTITDNGVAWILNNGILTVWVNKETGSLLSVIYHNIETLRPSVATLPDTLHWPATKPGSEYPTWQEGPASPVTASVTIDPAKNGGERAEVSVKRILRLRRVFPPGLVWRRVHARKPIRIPRRS
jgi:hypothetical protein